MDFVNDREQTARKLFEIATEIRKNAYAPFSKFRVGAALLTAEGKIYTGVNVENSSYGATICAERTAFVKAISEGEREFVALAISAGETEALPCGICRQFIYEFAPEIAIITGTDKENINIRVLEDLLPMGFRLEE
jgi:cytidine deaminase